MIGYVTNEWNRENVIESHSPHCLKKALLAAAFLRCMEDRTIFRGQNEWFHLRGLIRKLTSFDRSSHSIWSIRESIIVLIFKKMPLIVSNTSFNMHYRSMMMSNKGVKKSVLEMDYQQHLYALDGNCLAFMMYHNIVLDRKTAVTLVGYDRIITGHYQQE